jgi:hypothetical protein
MTWVAWLNIFLGAILVAQSVNMWLLTRALRRQRHRNEELQVEAARLLEEVKASLPEDEP